MKILHTADWHIGKSLYKHELYEDILLFFEQLKQIIKDESIELLLISGDIFDLANPSNRDKEIYYSFLTQLMEMKIRVIVTAGNHDSVRMLEAPKQLLKFLNIDIVGDARSLENQIIPIENSDGDLQCFICAVPYLRDRDIREVQAGEKYKDKVEAMRSGIVGHYKRLQSLAKSENDSVPLIAMGHLYMQGASISDSEREIQIGNEAGISIEHFDQLFDYMALGHIHRPQKLNKAGTVRYSGSPIALSFSERKDEKVVVIIDLSTTGIKEIEPLKLDNYRDLIRMKGTVDELKLELASFKNKTTLLSMIEIHAEEKEKDQTKVIELIELAGRDSDQYKIVHHKIRFENSEHKLIADRSEMEIEEMQPIDVFRARLEESVPDEDTRLELEGLFHELLEDWKES